MWLLPIFVSIGLTTAVFLMIYKIPPGWVSLQAAEIKASLDSLNSPTLLGDAIHHAMMKEDGALVNEFAEHANGIVHEAIPDMSKALAGEAVAALSVITTPGQANKLKAQSGAARGYLNLGGSIQRQAVKTGVQEMGMGMLGGIMEDPTWGPIAQQFIMNAVQNLGNNGPGPGPVQGGPVQQAKTDWRPPV